MMKLAHFVQQYPQYAFDFTTEIRHQQRIYMGAILDDMPVELEADHDYQAGSRGRPNPNQTLTHSQCATCHRILRNDMYYTVPSMMKRNVVFSHCRECNQAHNSERYETRAEVIRARRIAIYRFLAPACAACGFDQHFSALDLHHPQQKEAQVVELITLVTLSPSPKHAEALLREGSLCLPLCSNCHRMFHAGAIKLPAQKPASALRLVEFINILKSLI